MPTNLSEHLAGDGGSTEAIELAAAEWLVLQDRGVDANQQQAFDRWLAADPRHGVAYAQLKQTWHLLDHVPADRVPLPPHRGRRWFWVTGSLAVAAAAALVIAFVRPGLNGPRSLAPVGTAATPIGGFESLALADGSMVRLNTATEIAADFSATERRVTLVRGEASFNVVKDAGRPFIVRAGNVDVRAIGTVFNVRQSDRAIEVLVTEGKVRLQDVVSREPLIAAAPSADEIAATTAEHGPAPLLVAGQRATIVRPVANTPAKARVADLAPAESARALAWHSRQLEFSDEPLANIAAEFNRYSRHRMVIDDPELGAKRFGGKFTVDDSAGFVRLLELNFGVVAERRVNETVLRRGPAGR